MPLNNINENRPSVWRRRPFSSRLALFADGHAHPFVQIATVNAGLQKFAANVSEAQEQLSLGSAQSREISSCSFEHNLLIMTDRAFLKMFRFNRASLDEVIPLLVWPVNKRRTSYNGYTIRPKLAACAVLCRLATPIRWGKHGEASRKVCHPIFRDIPRSALQFRQCSG